MVWVGPFVVEIAYGAAPDFEAFALAADQACMVASEADGTTGAAAASVGVDSAEAVAGSVEPV